MNYHKYDVCNLFYSLSYKGLPMKKATLVIGVIGADCHAVGNKVLDRVFSNHGFRVINLGVMVSQDEYIDALLKLALTRLSSPLSMGMAISTVWACANAASSVDWGTSCSMWAVTWWSENMTSLTWKPNSKRWDLIASLPQVMT